MQLNFAGGRTHANSPLCKNPSPHVKNKGCNEGGGGVVFSLMHAEIFFSLHESIQSCEPPPPDD